MLVFLLVLGAAAVSLPIACVVLVSLASRREDRAGSLGAGPSGAMESAARRMVGFHADAIARPGRRALTDESAPPLVGQL